MNSGKVKWWNDSKGFGFITPDDGGDEIFMHFSELKMRGFKTLKEGQIILYDIKTGPKGAQACNIVLEDAETHTPPSKKGTGVLDFLLYLASFCITFGVILIFAGTRAILAPWGHSIVEIAGKLLTLGVWSGGIWFISMFYISLKSLLTNKYNGESLDLSQKLGATLFILIAICCAIFAAYEFGIFEPNKNY